MTPQDESQVAKRQVRLNHAIDRFRSYLEAGLTNEVRTALATKSISTSTMRLWMKDPKKLRTSYRWTEFVDAIETLSDLDQKRRNDAYEFALKELGAGRRGQSDLADYHGVYKVFHDFKDVEFNNFMISVEHSPFVVIFVFKYTQQDNKPGGRRGKCDGLIVLRHGRLICAGFSPSTVFQGVFHCVSYPKTDLIRGMAFMDDLEAKEVRFSRIVIAREPSLTSAKEAQDFVRGSGQTL